MKGKLLGIAQAVLLALVVLAGSIAVPVLFRPFFYWHIQPLDLVDNAGITAGEIKEAYREMMNYCIGITDTFSVGVLPFSADGAAHFADVRKLFLLDLWVLFISAALLIPVAYLCRKRPVRLAGHTSGFWSAIGLGAAFLMIGILAALNFRKAFEVFHKIFFPGKDNWVFSVREDPVILMLPMEFFRNCAILIGLLLVSCCTAILVFDGYVRKKDKESRLP